MSSAARRRGRLWLLLATGAVGAGLITVFVLRWRGPSDSPVDRPSFPPPRAEQPDSGPVFEDFVGSDACAGCHSSEYAMWRGSTHGRAGGAPNRERVIAAFNGEPIQFADARVTPLTRDGQYYLRVEEQGQAEQLLRVAEVVGGGFMVGGGTQAYFAEFPDGTLRFLPFDFVRQESAWFCQTNGRTDRGWAPITADMRLAECADWPPTRVMGSHRRRKNCQGCHGSQVELRFNETARRYETRYSTLAINCESCHGPGRQHVELARSGRLEESAEIGMRALAVLDKDESLVVCFQCHAVKDEIRPGYLPGKPLTEFFGLMLPLLVSRPLFPDGRIRTFAYQQQHRFSDCYLNGSMTCVDCHDPHSQRYRDIYRRPLEGRFSDGQCLDCHPSKAQSPERHTHHKRGSAGSACVACHMPFQQEPDVGKQLRYSRSDHTIPIPRPALDAILGVENACQKCHADRSLAELDEQITTWYGDLKPLNVSVEGLLRSQRAEDRPTAARMMLAAEGDHPALHFNGLTYFFLTSLSPDMPGLENEIVERLAMLARSEDLDLQALALASLHFALGEVPEVRSFLAGSLGALGARDGAVRRRWVWILNFRGDIYSARGQYLQALKSYQKAAEVLPEDAQVLASLGTGYVNAGAYDRAISYYRASLEIDPAEALTLVGLAFALAARGDIDESLATYRRAIEINPWEPSTYVSLGNAHSRRGLLREAIEAYDRALGVEPGVAAAHFGRGAAYSGLGNHDRAIAAFRRGLELEPGNAEARQSLANLERQIGKPNR